MGGADQHVTPRRHTNIAATKGTRNGALHTREKQANNIYVYILVFLNLLVVVATVEKWFCCIYFDQVETKTKPLVETM